MEKSTEQRGNLISFLYPRYLITKCPLSLHCFASLAFVLTFLFWWGVGGGVSSAVDVGQLSRVTEEEDENSKQELHTAWKQAQYMCSSSRIIIQLTT